MKITGNESANPVIVTKEHYDGYRYVTNTHSIGGMTIHQQFAMSQMQALASRGEFGYSDAEGDAEEAVIRANALIKALNKEVPNE